jgi:class 3 adenylate cyclase
VKCLRCQHENPPGSAFCLECGGRLAPACASCGAELPAGSKFCNKCGTPVKAEAAPQSRFPSPDSYTPKHLAEKILTSKTALEGERKQVTVLFADLKGSMELLADRDPEEARKLLDPVLERMMEAVHRYEGTVNQVMGDGIMALFGAPLAYEDHAVRACYAALRIQESVKRYAEEMRRAEGIPIQIRVGLNSGDVVVRSIGSDLRMDYTAVGQTTHLAARMEQMASPGTILLTPETLALAEGFVQVVSLGQLGVKGLLAPLEAFELTGASPVRSRLQAAALRGLTPFVGRDAEIELLRQALERARRGRGQVVGVVGEPGVGKSRLIWEFTRSYRTRDWLVLTASAASYSKATTYFAVVEALKSYFQVEPRDDARKIREKLTGKLLALDRALAPALPVFLSLLDIPVDDREWTSLSPPERRRQTLDALKRLLLRESQVQPLVLVFEDLHWIDSETQALLDGLIESVPTARIFLLISYRPEYTHAWGSKTYFQQLRLDVLPAATADELLDALVGREAGLGALKNRLIERTEGNPFFLEEAVRALVETEMLVGERGDYRLAGPVRSLQLPATAQAILAARIDRLPPWTSDCFKRPRLSVRTCPLSCFSPLLTRQRKSFVPCWPDCRPQSSSMKRSSFQTWNTPSSTPSPTRWPMGASSASAAMRFTPPWLWRTSASMLAASPSTWSALSTTRRGARSGTRLWSTLGRPGPGQRPARRTAKRQHVLSRRYRRWRNSPRVAIRWSRPSTCGASCAMPCCRSTNRAAW